MKEFGIPSGMRDLVLDEAKKKRALQERIEKRLDTWGYQEVITPSIEFYRTYDVGFEDIQEENMYKFFDDNGRVLSLKADMTIPIARVVATKFKNSSEPLRFRYCANVFKVHETLSGNKNEITDCGVELVGLSKEYGDLEILVTALDALSIIEDSSVMLEIGDIEFFKYACEGANIKQSDMDTLGKLLDSKNLIDLENFLSKIGIEEAYKDFFLRMIWWNGDVTMLQEVKQYAFNDKLIAIIENLEALDTQLDTLGYGNKIIYDLAKIGNINYYTGIIFDAFVEGIGFRVLSGGRYDNLIKKYGADFPAVGFSIKLDQLMDAFTYENSSTSTLIEYGNDGLLAALEKRKQLDDKNNTIVLKRNDKISGIEIKEVYNDINSTNKR